MEIKKLKYQDFIKYEPTFLSLDISIHSTGWVFCEKGVITCGTKELESPDELNRRIEFRNFLKSKIGDKYIPVVFVEDVFAGTNFKTVKGLIQLNTIVDDLKVFGEVSVGEIKRVDNRKWKMYLKKATNFETVIKKENDKDIIKSCLNDIGFNDDIIKEKLKDCTFSNKGKQDIYDAMGIAISIIYRDNILKEEPKTSTPLKIDLKSGYTIKQYFGPTESNMDFYKNIGKLKIKYNREIEELDWSNEARDILYLFKQKIRKDAVDNKIYIIKVNNMKLGVLALTKKLNTDIPFSYLIITKTK